MISNEQDGIKNQGGIALLVYIRGAKVIFFLK
jgi:hypothetical protein